MKNIIGIFKILLLHLCYEFLRGIPGKDFFADFTGALSDARIPKKQLEESVQTIGNRPETEKNEERRKNEKPVPQLNLITY